MANVRLVPLITLLLSLLSFCHRSQCLCAALISGYHISVRVQRWPENLLRQLPSVDRPYRPCHSCGRNWPRLCTRLLEFITLWAVVVSSDSWLLPARLVACNRNERTPSCAGISVLIPWTWLSLNVACHLAKSCHFIVSQIQIRVC